MVTGNNSKTEEEKEKWGVIRKDSPVKKTESLRLFHFKQRENSVKCVYFKAVVVWYECTSQCFGVSVESNQSNLTMLPEQTQGNTEVSIQSIWLLVELKKRRKTWDESVCMDCCFNLPVHMFSSPEMPQERMQYTTWLNVYKIDR